ncbi:family transcriptional regulator [Leptolyngbya sp. Heron Island J]|uniref:response regulator n=1 Tax=Leptolyngbya sp. Heron Island J TaxID=1385935 RepID=UPI0003B96601|nr:response regulator transcription factor [Leptolyngbya sp. Heron Island J]ESA31951.1 family transcriptional regulator [Leptolyngbya sp. Heron Island J]
MSQNLIRVLIADDHPIVRNGLTLMLRYSNDLELIGEASTGKEAVELYRQQQPDVVLMDLRMPEMGGVEAITTIRQEFPDARIIVLSTYDYDEDIYQGLQAGAKGYLLKDISMEILQEAIRQVYGGQKYIPADVAMKLAERLSTPQLTGRETQILELMVQGKSNAEMGRDLYISENTIKFHINNILLKLDVKNRGQAIVTAIQRGIVKV